MTHIEANKLMDACHDAACHDVNTEITDYLLNEAYAALNKQVPQKMKYDGKREWTCPRCGTLLYNSREFKECLSDIFVYCPECGQRLEQEM